MKLNEVKTVNDYLTYLLVNFDTDNCKPGSFSKSTLIYSILNLIKGLSPRSIAVAQTEAMRTNNITEFIIVIKRNFDTRRLIDVTPEKLEHETKRLCSLISLKPKPVKPLPEQVKHIVEETAPEIKPDKKEGTLSRNIKRILKGGKRGK